MRSCLLKYLGCNNVLVRFNISSILMALQLTLDATRVVDIGLEFAYQRWCGPLAQRARRFFDLVVPNLCVPYDSRWPAILYGNSFKLTIDGRDDILRDVYYTAALWQVIRDWVAENRACLEVHMMKRLCKFGCGAGLVLRDLLLLEEKVDLLVLPRSRLANGPTAAMWPETSELTCTAEPMVEQAEEAPEIRFARTATTRSS